MAGISKKKVKYKNGTQKIFYTISYRDIYGKQHTKGCYKTMAEAKKHLNKFENVNPSIVDITYEQIFKCFMENQLKTYSHTTQENYKLYTKNILSKLFPLKYDKTSSIYLQQFIDDIVQEYTPYVAQLCLKISKAACNYALKHKLINENKFLAVNNVIVSPKNNKHLTEAQEKEVLKYCKILYPKYYPFLCTLMGSGMRIGEVIALEVTDINYENKSIKVNKQFTKGQLKQGTKNRARIVQTNERDVYITSDIISVLKEHVKSLPVGTTILFPSQVNGYLSDNNIRRRVWEPLLAYTGITDRVRIHDLRGSYVDIAFAHNASIKFVQNQLGHAKAQTTLDVYARNSQDNINSALDDLEGIFKSDEM
ncbi:site-specific integrase [bacterium]|nr:site-specific integrase [bacterium]